jgi:hypothetical protein
MSGFVCEFVIFVKSCKTQIRKPDSQIPSRLSIDHFSSFLASTVTVDNMETNLIVRPLFAVSAMDCFYSIRLLFACQDNFATIFDVTVFMIVAQLCLAGYCSYRSWTADRNPHVTPIAEADRLARFHVFLDVFSKLRLGTTILMIILTAGDLISVKSLHKDILRIFLYIMILDFLSVLKFFVDFPERMLEPLLICGREFGQQKLLDDVDFLMNVLICMCLFTVSANYYIWREEENFTVFFAAIVMQACIGIRYVLIG